MNVSSTLQGLDNGTEAVLTLNTCATRALLDQIQAAPAVRECTRRNGNTLLIEREPTCSMADLAEIVVDALKLTLQRHVDCQLDKLQILQRPIPSSYRLAG